MFSKWMLDGNHIYHTPAGFQYQDKLFYHIRCLTIHLFAFFKQYLGIFPYYGPNILCNLSSVIFSMGHGTKQALIYFTLYIYIDRLQCSDISNTIMNREGGHIQCEQI